MSQNLRILVFRFSSMGDVAMTVPVIREFLEQNPKAEIVFVSRKQFEPLFDSIKRLTFFSADLNGRHSGIIGLYRLSKELKRIGFDRVADLHCVLRTQIITKFLNEKMLAVLDKGRKERAELVSQKNKIRKQLKPMTERYADVFRNLGFELRLSHHLKKTSSEKENAIGIAPFALYEGKSYPLTKMKTVALEIAKKGTMVYLFGSKQENRELSKWEELHPNIFSIAGKYDLKKELEIMSLLKVMVSMDSANMHLASMVGTRVISIWGNTHPFMGFLGYGQRYEDVIQDESMKQRPTSVYGKEPKNSQKTDYFRNIPSEIIIKKIEEFL